MSETGKGAPERIWVLLKSGEAHFKKPTHFNADAPEYVHIDKVRELEAEVARLIRENAVLGSDGSAARKSAAKNLARAEAAEARLAPDGVAVKALEWRDTALIRSHAWLIVAVAKTPFGDYGIEKNESGDFSVTLTGQVLLNTHPTTKEDAKAAAQADFDQRIRSALYTHPASDTALREALEALRNFANQYRSGAQGAWMDADAAKELAALIDAALNPTSEKTDGTA